MRAADTRTSGPRADERRAVASPVDCRRCGITVLVAKFSAAHTSVQWPAGGPRNCAEFSDRVSSLVQTCATLRACIDDAVDAGAVEIVPP
jgi:hypothetical protein